MERKAFKKLSGNENLQAGGRAPKQPKARESQPDWAAISEGDGGTPKQLKCRAGEGGSQAQTQQKAHESQPDWAAISEGGGELKPKARESQPEAATSEGGRGSQKEQRAHESQRDLAAISERDGGEQKPKAREFQLDGAATSEGSSRAQKPKARKSQRDLTAISRGDRGEQKPKARKVQPNWAAISEGDDLWSSSTDAITPVISNCTRDVKNAKRGISPTYRPRPHPSEIRVPASLKKKNGKKSKKAIDATALLHRRKKFWIAGLRQANRESNRQTSRLAAAPEAVATSCSSRDESRETDSENESSTTSHFAVESPGNAEGVIDPPTPKETRYESKEGEKQAACSFLLDPSSSPTRAFASEIEGFGVCAGTVSEEFVQNGAVAGLENNTEIDFNAYAGSFPSSPQEGLSTNLTLSVDSGVSSSPRMQCISHGQTSRTSAQVRSSEGPHGLLDGQDDYPCVDLSDEPNRTSLELHAKERGLSGHVHRHESSSMVQAELDQEGYVSTAETRNQPQLDLMEDSQPARDTTSLIETSGTTGHDGSMTHQQNATKSRTTLSSSVTTPSGFSREIRAGMSALASVKIDFQGACKNDEPGETPLLQPTGRRFDARDSSLKAFHKSRFVRRGPTTSSAVGRLELQNSNVTIQEFRTPVGALSSPVANSAALQQKQNSAPMESLSGDGLYYDYVYASDGPTFLEQRDMDEALVASVPKGWKRNTCTLTCYDHPDVGRVFFHPNVHRKGERIAKGLPKNTSQPIALQQIDVAPSITDKSHVQDEESPDQMVLVCDQIESPSPDCQERWHCQDRRLPRSSHDEDDEGFHKGSLPENKGDPNVHRQLFGVAGHENIPNLGSCNAKFPGRDTPELAGRDTPEFPGSDTPDSRSHDMVEFAGSKTPEFPCCDTPELSRRAMDEISKIYQKSRHLQSSHSSSSSSSGSERRRIPTLVFDDFSESGKPRLDESGDFNDPFSPLAKDRVSNEDGAIVKDEREDGGEGRESGDFDDSFGDIDDSISPLAKGRSPNEAGSIAKDKRQDGGQGREIGDFDDSFGAFDDSFSPLAKGRVSNEAGSMAKDEGQTSRRKKSPSAAHCSLEKKFWLKKALSIIKNRVGNKEEDRFSIIPSATATKKGHGISKQDLDRVSESVLDQPASHVWDELETEPYVHKKAPCEFVCKGGDAIEKRGAKRSLPPFSTGTKRRRTPFN